MKCFIFVAIIYSLLYGSVLRGQNKDSLLVLGGLNSDYKKHSNISFQIKNVSQDSIFVGLGIQQYANNTWEDLQEDIFARRIQKSNVVIVLGSKECETINWKPMFYLPMYDGKKEVKIHKMHIKGIFRFKVKYDTNLRDLKHCMYSNSFNLK